MNRFSVLRLAESSPPLMKYGIKYFNSCRNCNSFSFCYQNTTDPFFIQLFATKPARTIKCFDYSRPLTAFIISSKLFSRSIWEIFAGKYFSPFMDWHKVSVKRLEHFICAHSFYGDIKLKFQFDMQTDKVLNEALNIMEI